MKNLLISSMICLSLIACGGGDDSGGSGSNSTVTIPTLNLSDRASYSKPTQGSETIEIEIKFSLTASSEGSFDYKIVGDTADSSLFDEVSGTVSFKKGDRSVKIPLTLHFNGKIEDDKSISLIVSNAKNIKIDNSTMSIDIEETNSYPTLKTDSRKSFKENDSNAVIDINLSKVAPFDGSITIEVEHITTNDKDFAIKPVWSFKSGDRKVPIKVEFNDDGLFESDETFNLKVLSVTELDGNLLPEIEVTIEETTPKPTLSFMSSDAMVLAEGSTQSIDVSLSGPVDRDVDISLSLSGTANESDYTLSSGKDLVVKSGETDLTFDIYAIEDQVPEGGETIQITVGSISETVSVTDSKHSIVIPGTFTINDSGATNFSNSDGTFTSNYLASFPGQDAEYGFDVTNYDNSDGHAGRSYTKLDSQGNTLSSSASSYSCVRDNITGITWENKNIAVTDLPNTTSHSISDYRTDEGYSYPYYDAHNHFNALNYRYTWYDKDLDTNGGGSGSQSFKLNNTIPANPFCAFPHSWDNILPATQYPYYRNAGYCNTEVYIEYLNTVSYCGNQDWSLPTVTELRSLHIYHESGNQSPIDYFENTNIEGDYLSSTPTPDSAGGSVYCINAKTGQVKRCAKNVHNAVRARSGGTN